jgi:hypothetical protein
VYWSRFDQTIIQLKHNIIGQKIILEIRPQKVTFAIQIISSTFGHFGAFADSWQDILESQWAIKKAGPWLTLPCSVALSEYLVNSS